MNTREFGNLMRAARERAGVTLRQLATRLSWSVPYLSDIERARRDPPSDEIIRVIAQVIDEDSGLLRAAAIRSRRVVRIDQDRLTVSQRQALHALLESWGHPT